jgi:predicted GIY-YIG superfamily endonuclease
MYYTYILKQKNKQKFYVGCTNNLLRRLREHNYGSNISTRGRLWTIHCYIAFVDKRSAESFEKYLKSHSGRSFSKKHFGFECRETA